MGAWGDAGGTAPELRWHTGTPCLSLFLANLHLVQLITCLSPLPSFASLSLPQNRTHLKNASGATGVTPPIAVLGMQVCERAARNVQLGDMGHKFCGDINSGCRGLGVAPWPGRLCAGMLRACLGTGTCHQQPSLYLPCPCSSGSASRDAIPAPLAASLPRLGRSGARCPSASARRFLTEAGPASPPGCPDFLLPFHGAPESFQRAAR